MAGRSLDKLASVRDAIGAPADTALIAADASDPASLKAMIDADPIGADHGRPLSALRLRTGGGMRRHPAPIISISAASRSGCAR